MSQLITRYEIEGLCAIEVLGAHERPDPYAELAERKSDGPGRTALTPSTTSIIFLLPTRPADETLGGQELEFVIAAIPGASRQAPPRRTPDPRS
jgi:hypothetical protein